MQIKFTVTGMSCAACSARVEKVTKQVSGVLSADVNLLNGSMTVEAESKDVISNISKAVADAGYSATPDVAKTVVEKTKSDAHMQNTKMRIVFSAFFLVVLMYFTMGHMVGLPLPGWYAGRENLLVAALLQFLLTLPVVVLNRSYYMKGFKALIHRAPNMDTLIAVGSGAALAYSIFVLFRLAAAFGAGDDAVISQYCNSLYFESAAMILTLITVGKFLESRAKGKAGDAVRALMDLAPKQASVLRNGLEMVIPVDQLVVGDIVVIRSGDRIQVDGTVLSGHAAVDQSPITGESIPVDKQKNDFVSAGTICTEGYLLFRAERIGEDTTLAQVIRLVEEAGGSKAPIARLADKIAGVFVPVVMAIALITCVVWLLIGQTFEFALTTAIAVLVISCPCALGLATPVAIMVGTGRGAGMGVLFKNAMSLENLHKVDTVVLDKTGTITAGKPAVIAVYPHNMQQQAFVDMAASVEAKSQHPFAAAIVKYCGREVADSQSFTIMAGRGVSAIVDGITIYGGNQKLMQELGLTVPEYLEHSARGGTPLYFASQNQYYGCIVVADVIREDAAEVINCLHKLHIDVVMLTGDNEKTAKAIAKKANIHNIISDVLPTQKAAAITQLQKQGRNVLMVGDGINDAPALAAANVGMAVGTGTDIAMESADVVLMNNSLMGIYNAIVLSKTTIRNIKQNLFWAFFYNSLGIPVAAGVLYPSLGILLSPMIGAAAMSFSSFFVVTNALRLRLFKPKSISGSVQMPVEEEKIMEQIIQVEGMMCPHCQARVESVCKGVSGTVDAVVDLQKKQVTVTGNADRAALEAAITAAGYEVVG